MGSAGGRSSAVSHQHLCHSTIRLTCALEFATMMPLWNMSRRPTSAESSVLMPLSPSPYVGLGLYIARGQKLLGLLALTTILSDFLPIFLANVPFSNSITYNTFEACVWLSVAVLGFMLVVLVTLMGLLVVHPSRYSADLKTLGGVLHLVCGSEETQRELRWLSSAGRAGVETRIKSLNRKYSMGSTSDGGRGPCIVVHDS